MNEVGAAIHIAPNASRILKSWGIDFEDLQAVFCNAIKVYDNNGKLIFVPVVGLCSVIFLAQFVLSLRPQYRRPTNFRRRLGLKTSGC